MASIVCLRDADLKTDTITLDTCFVHVNAYVHITFMLKNNNFFLFFKSLQTWKNLNVNFLHNFSDFILVILFLKLYV